jgi:hypothetical protein
MARRWPTRRRRAAAEVWQFDVGGRAGRFARTPKAPPATWPRRRVCLLHGMGIGDTSTWTNWSGQTRIIISRAKTQLAYSDSVDQQKDCVMCGAELKAYLKVCKR